jgi:DnaJ-class molecular chaperone
LNKNTTENYYEILGISYNATQNEIKSAFRKAVIKYHPDVNKAGKEMFIKIKEAYETLSNPKEKILYDMSNGYDIKRQQSKTAADFKPKQKNFEKQTYKYDYSEHYANTKMNSEAIRQSHKSRKTENRHQTTKEERFYKAIRNVLKKIFTIDKKIYNKDIYTEQKDGEDITMPVEISYKEALNGTNRKINVLHTEVCPICGGKSFSNGSKCNYCNGSGEISLHKKLNVKIPPHTENNKKIRLRNEGTKGLNGGKNGHLYLVVKITDDSYFMFDGNNVLLELEITPSEAALGCKKEIRTLSGKAKLTIPQGTSSGQKFRLANEGLFDETIKAKGDEIVTIKIKINENLSERERQLYQELNKIQADK